jgi:DNA-binding NarL/FixJ family response regulator
VSRARILLADDHPALLHRVSDILSSTYEIVGTATNGQELVTEATRLKPDVVVLDITMPVMDGIEAAYMLRKLGVSTRVVFLTVHDEEEFITACLEEGAQAYVLKAHMKTHLVPAIEAVLMGCTFLSPAHSPQAARERYPR